MNTRHLKHKISELHFAKERCLDSCSYIRHLPGKYGKYMMKHNFECAVFYEHRIQMLEIELARMELK